MKKVLTVLIVNILVLSSLGIIVLATEKTNNMHITTKPVTFSKPVMYDEGQYITVNLEAATSFLATPTWPKIPFVTKVFTFPFGTTIRTVTVSFSNTYELVVKKPLIPVTEPFPVVTEEISDLVQDPAIYDSADVYPVQSYSYTTGAGLDGTDHVIYLAVHCYPIRYVPAANMIFYSENADIQITYEDPKTPTVFSDDYNLVIIAPSEFSTALQPLITHKMSVGISTILKTTEEIYVEYEGFDQAEQIKYFIKDAIETWGVDYVFLVGNVYKLPIRVSNAMIWEENLLTDLYYADIYDENGSFCSWDKDGDGIYGEVYRDHHEIYDIDGVDLYPDVNIGRLPCENTAEVTTVVNKIIHYETTTKEESWFNNIILIGGDTFPSSDGNEGEEQNLVTEQLMSEFTSTKLWTSDGTFTARALNQAINNGAGFIDYSGHGFEIGVATHPPDSEEWVPYHTNHLLSAHNGDKLPIIFFDACLTAKLDFNLAELFGYASESLQVFIEKYPALASILFPTFAWVILKKTNGGAIATIGATRTAFGSMQYGCGYLAIHFWQAYATSETLSQMLTKAQNDYITNIPNELITVEEFILIGDPSLKIGGYET
jgi:hypothetical protein